MRFLLLQTEKSIGKDSYVCVMHLIYFMKQLTKATFSRLYLLFILIFFQKICFQNSSCQTQSVAYLLLWPTCWCLQYVVFRKKL